MLAAARSARLVAAILTPIGAPIELTTTPVEALIDDVAAAVQSALDTVTAIGTGRTLRAFGTLAALDSFRSFGPFGALESLGTFGALRPWPIGVNILSQRGTAEYRQRQRAACYPMSVSHFVLLELRQ